MELNITSLVKTIDAPECSGSMHERGENAAQETWSNSKVQGKENPVLDSSDKLAAMRGHIAEFGAWDDEEIKAFTDEDLNGFLVQLVAGDMREYSDDDIEEWDWADYNKEIENGSISGRIFEAAGEYYYYIGM